MSKFKETVKKHKVLSFMALGGMGVATLMHAGLVNDFLPVPQLGVALGGYALGRLRNFNKLETGLFKSGIKKNSFLALGAFGTMAAIQAFDGPNVGLTQITLAALASYGLHGLISSVKSGALNKVKKPTVNHDKDLNNFKMPEKNQAQATIDKLRQKPQEDVEFQPLNLR